MKPKKNVLVGALHWGLGHATRCIPIIDALLEREVQVVLAADGAALELWQQHYPQLPTEELPSYGIHYPSNNMVWNMGRQVPQILQAIRQERQHLGSLIKKHALDAVLSDNRYGLQHPSIPCVFITHQLHLPLPTWLFPPFWNAWHRRFLRQFDACWVPDWEGEHSLAGKLAHPAPLGQVAYVGGLSRFSKVEKLEKKWEVLVVLSGPEPQRQYFEAALVEQLSALQVRSLIVRGKPSQEQRKQLAPHLYQQDFMPQAALQQAFGESKVVIARSGYSTVMDLAALGITGALLVPTPGQTEQEYLAQRLALQGRAVVQRQDHLQVAQGLKAVATLPYKTFSYPSTDRLALALDVLLRKK